MRREVPHCSSGIKYRLRACSKSRLRTQDTLALYYLRGRRTGEKDAAVEKPAKDSFNPLQFLAKVGASKTILEFQKNQTVFAQGDVADTVFYIQTGKVKLTVLSEQGKEAVVAILEPGQFFGEGCLNGQRLRTSAIAGRIGAVLSLASHRSASCFAIADRSTSGAPIDNDICFAGARRRKQLDLHRLRRPAGRAIEHRGRRVADCCDLLRKGTRLRHRLIPRYEERTRHVLSPNAR